jgi:Raf kinase inhibitor-like YbhB/YbcL family protein
MRSPRLPLLASLLLALSVSARAGDFRIASPDFTDGASIPARFTCEGQNISPALAIIGAPATAKSLVLIVDDPDAPGGTFTHWLVWNIPPATSRIPSDAAPSAARVGTDDFGTLGYSGPCPPSGTHRYFFRLSALDTTLNLPMGASRREVDAAIQGHVIATASLMGRYAKNLSH